MGNCRTRDKGPSDLFGDVWQENWEENLEKKHRKIFYPQYEVLGYELGVFEVKI